MRTPVPLSIFSIFSIFPPGLRGAGQRGAHSAALALLVASATLSPIASGQTAATAATAASLDTSGDFKSEMASCADRGTPQARALCISEARTAQTAKRAGKLENHGGNFHANALKRCEVFQTADDQAACRARVEGKDIEGSVLEGGILRESTSTVTIPGNIDKAPAPMPE